MAFRSPVMSAASKRIIREQSTWAHTLLHNLARCYRHYQFSTIQVPDHKFTTSKCGLEVDLDVDHEVVIVALEACVRLLFDNNDNIAWNDSGRLIAFVKVGDRLAILHALVDVHFEHLLLRNDLTRVAIFALVTGIDDLASTRALIAWMLKLLDHGTHLAQGDTDA